MDPWPIFLPRFVSFCGLTSQSFQQETRECGKDRGFGSRGALIKSLYLTRSSCVMMDRFLNFSESQFAHIFLKSNHTHLINSFDG